MDRETIRRNLAERSDAELREVVGPERDTYRPEAVQIAEEELARRGVPLEAPESVEETIEEILPPEASESVAAGKVVSPESSEPDSNFRVFLRVIAVGVGCILATVAIFGLKGGDLDPFSRVVVIGCFSGALVYLIAVGIQGWVIRFIPSILSSLAAGTVLPVVICVASGCSDPVGTVAYAFGMSIAMSLLYGSIAPLIFVGIKGFDYRPEDEQGEETPEE